MDGLAPDVLNYMVGKGKVWFSRLSADNVPMGEMDLGNDPVFASSLENELLEHYSSMEGVKKKDMSAIISTAVNLKFTLDEPNPQNLNLAFLGNDEVSYETQPGGTVNNEAMTARLDRYVKVLRRAISLVTVTDATGAVTYVLGTDYTVDTVTGRIFCLSTGNILQGEPLLVDYTFDELRMPKIIPAGRAKVEGLLRFKGSPTYGRDYELVFWKVLLSSSGDINFISDDWTQIEFTGEALDDSVNHPGEAFGKILDLDGDQISES